MATYGAAGTNPYTIKGVGGILSNEVNSTTGVTQVYKGGALTTQQSLGTYNPTTKKFTPNANVNLTDAEKKALSSPEGLKAITNASIQTAQKAGATNPSQLISPNTTNTQPTGDQITTVGGLQQQTQDKDVRMKYDDFNILRYPLDRDTKQDYIKVTMLRYSPRSVDPGQAGGDSGSVFGSRGQRSILGSVSLPIQPSISDTNAVVWGEDRMNAIQAKAAMESLNMMVKGAAGAEESANRTAEGVSENAGSIKALVGFSLAEKAVGNEAGNFFTRATGAIVNPNLELLFQGPSLRSFTFTFKLSARSEKEADVIKKIIRFFKQGMSVKRATTSLFLKSPNTFEISYIYGETSKDHPWINKIKECALQNFTVNYTPEGNYATYTDGSMTSYELTMTFGELDPIYDDDYQKLDENKDEVIGY